MEQGVESEGRQAPTLADSAKRSRISHFVYSSVAASDRKTRIPHFESMKEAFSRMEGREVRYEQVPRDQFEQRAGHDHLRALAAHPLAIRHDGVMPSRFQAMSAKPHAPMMPIRLRKAPANTERGRKHISMRCFPGPATTPRRAP